MERYGPPEDFNEPTRFDGGPACGYGRSQDPPEQPLVPANPWYLKPAILVGWGVLIGLLMALLGWGIAQLLGGGSDQTSTTTSTTPATTTTTTTATTPGFQLPPPPSALPTVLQPPPGR